MLNLWRSELKQARYGANLKGQPDRSLDEPQKLSGLFSIVTTTVVLQLRAYLCSYLMTRPAMLRCTAATPVRPQSWHCRLRPSSKPVPGNGTVSCSAPQAMWLAASRGFMLESKVTKRSKTPGLPRCVHYFQGLC